MKISSAFLKISQRSYVTSPSTLTANPGPGKGCLSMNSFGKPSSLPTALTSSLNNSLNGSNSFKFILSGNPPTL